MNITESTRRIAEQFYEAFNRGDLDAAADCFDEKWRKLLRTEMTLTAGSGLRRLTQTQKLPEADKHR